MRTVKLVIIGNSGVGKTSLRGQYVSARFLNGYRATIGTDFITKSVPRLTDPSESITLQIWDTAGQERFSSLSTAFFRGADAALLLFDVNRPETLHSLERWWTEFRERAPVKDEDVKEFCVVFVGNKIDLVEEGEEPSVGWDEAREFVERLVPSAGDVDEEEEEERAKNTSLVVSSAYEDEEERTIPPPQPPPPPPIDITHTTKRLSKSSLLFSSSSSGPGGTLSSVRTTLTTFHTPSSSFFDTTTTTDDDYDNDHFVSARSSLRSTSPPVRRRISLASMSSSSGATITPSIFTRRTPLRETTSTPPTPVHDVETTRKKRRLKLVYTSAKSGEGVADVFEYVARTVVEKWEWEEAREARTLGVVDLGEDEGEEGRSAVVGLYDGWKGLRKERSCCAI